MSAAVRVALVSESVEGDEAGLGWAWARLRAAAALIDGLAGLDARPVLVRQRGTAGTVGELTDLASRFAVLVLVGFDAPRCFAIERGLAERAPGLVVLHERHGLAVAALVGLRDGLRLRGGSPGGARVVVRGASAASVGVIGLLGHVGVGEVVALSRDRILAAGDVDPCAEDQVWLAAHTNPGRLRGRLVDAATGAVAIVDLAGGEWDVGATAGLMAPRPVLLFLSPRDATRQVAEAPAAAIAASCVPNGPDAIAGLAVLAGLANGLATMGSAVVGDDVLQAAATGLESALGRSQLQPLRWGRFDPAVAVVVAEAVGARAPAHKRVGRPPFALTPGGSPSDCG